MPILHNLIQKIEATETHPNCICEISITVMSEPLKTLHEEGKETIYLLNIDAQILNKN